MKKSILFLFTICLLIATTGYAQKMQFGMKGGINLANYGGDVSNNQYKLGPHLGGYLRIRVLEKLSIQPELLYSLQGAKFKSKPLNFNYKEHLHYINIPVVAQFTILEHFNVQAGPYLGFFLGGRKKGEEYGRKVNEKIESIKPLDFGLVFGLGYEFKDWLHAGIRYNLGLLNIEDNKPGNGMGNGDGGYYYETPDIRLTNRVLQLYVAFPIKNFK